MKWSYLTLSIMALVIVLKWTVGFKEDADLDTLQNGLELMVMIVVLLEIAPRLIKKIKNDDVKHILGVVPTICILGVIAYTIPDINPALLELLALALIIVNLLTLTVFKRWFAKKYGSSIHHNDIAAQDE